MASTFINGTSAYAYLTIGSTRIEPGSIAVDPGLTITQTLCGETGYGIGGFASSELVVSVATSSLPQLVAGQEITVYMGFRTGGTEDNPVFSTVPVGKFYSTPDKVVTKGIFTTITAYDASYFASGQYVVDATPATVGALVTDVANKAGLTLASNVYAGLTRPTSTPVRDNMNGLTYRDVIAHCALLLGANACMTRDGKLKFVVPGTTSVRSYGPGDYIYDNYTLQSNAAYVMDRLEIRYPHEVVYNPGTEDQYTEEVTDTFIYQTAGSTSQKGLQISTTEIRTQAETDAFGSALFGSNGIEIYGYSLGVGGRPEIDLGDMITLIDDTNVTRKLYVMAHTIAFNGSMISTFAANVPESDVSTFDSTARPTLSEQVKALTSTAYETKRLVVDSVVAASARIDNVEAKAITTDKLDAGTAEIRSLITKNVNTDTVAAKVVASDELKANYAHIANGYIDNANIDAIQINKINGNPIVEGSILAEALAGHMATTLGGNKVIYQAEQPTGTDWKQGDTWYKTVVKKKDENDPTSPDTTVSSSMYVWSGSAWVETPLDAKMFRAGSITAQEISTEYEYAGIVYADKIIVGSKESPKGGLNDQIDRFISTDTSKAYTKGVPQGANYTRVQRILGETIDNFEHRNYIPNSREEVTLTNTALQTSKSHNFTAPTSGLSAMRGQNITVSFEVRINEPLTVGTTNAWFGINFSIYHDGTTRTYARNLSSRLVGSVGQWVKVTNTQPVADVNIVEIRDLQYLFRDIKGSVSIRNAKIEVGSTATMWTPAPEDGLLIDATPTNVTSVGKNIFDVTSSEIGKAWNNATNSARAINRIELEVGKTYTISGSNGNCDGVYRGFMDNVGAFPTGVGQVTFPYTFTATTGAILLAFNKTNIGIDDIKSCNIQVERSNVATQYSPYTTNSLNVNYGTLRSCGNVHDERDLVRGVDDIRVGQIDLGTLNWTYSTSRTHKFFYTEISDRSADPRGKILCSMYSDSTKVSADDFGNNAPDKSVGYNVGVGGKQIYIRDDSYTSATTFKTAMQGVLLNYELAEPIEEEINVTGTLLPVAGGGTITFENGGDDYGLQVPLSSTNEWWYLASSVRMDSFDSITDAKIDNTVASVGESIQSVKDDVGSVSTRVESLDSITTTQASQIGKLGEELLKKSLLAQGYATIDNGTLTLGYSDNEWKLVARGDGIDLMYGGTTVGTFGKYGANGSQLKANNSELQTVRFRSTQGGTLGLVTSSDGHVTLKEVR